MGRSFAKNTKLQNAAIVKVRSFSFTCTSVGRDFWYINPILKALKHNSNQRISDGLGMAVMLEVPLSNIGIMNRTIY